MARWPSRHSEENGPPRSGLIVRGRAYGVELDMWSLADRVVKAVSDVTVGTVIVLVHIALADRQKRRMALIPSRTN